MDGETLYAHLPVVLQNLAVGWEGRRIRRRRYGRRFAQLEQSYINRSLSSVEEIRAFRDRRLREFICFAADRVPYYRNLFLRLGIRPGDITGLNDLAGLPVLDKQTVQQNTALFCPDSPLKGRRTFLAHTSGTTGAGLRFPVTCDAHREQFAVWWRYWRWHGIGHGTLCLYFGGRPVVPVSQTRPPYWRYNRPGRQVLFSAYHLSRETASDYLDEMARSGARWVHGYPSMIARLASFMLESGRRLDVGWVTLGAESVLPQQAALIRQAFGVAPIDHYGMAEAVANISMCPEGNRHVDEDFAPVEFLPVGGDQYRVIGTNVSNPAFPLIRYEVGDTVTLSGGTCSCGRPGRVVMRIDGRREDYIVTTSGACIGRLDHILKDLVHVREAQIRQDAVGRMTILVVRGPAYGEEDERRLRAETFKRVGDSVDFDIRYVEALPKTSAGKLRFVVSTLPHGRIDGGGQDSIER